MKKNKLLILLLILFTSLHPITVFASTHSPRLLVIGDSISSGYGLEGYPDGKPENYGKILANALGVRSQDDYVNLSIDGETTFGLLWRISEMDKSLYSGFDTVVISSGGNDLLDSLMPSLMSLIGEFSGDSYHNAELLSKIKLVGDKFFSKTKQTADLLGDNLDKSIEMLRQNNPDAFIAVLSIYDPFSDENNSALYKLIDKTVIKPCISIINDAIRSSAQKNGVHYIDIFKAFEDNARKLTNISELDIHPNSNGHRLIADKLKEEYEAIASSSVFLSVNEAGVPKDLPRSSPHVIIASLFICTALIAVALKILKMKKIKARH